MRDSRGGKDFGYRRGYPDSQIVGTQAVLNVLAGERYKNVTKESKALLRGEYGKLPASPDPEVLKNVLNGEKQITHRFADDIPPELDKYREEIKEYIEQEEDVLSYALFPQVALNFFKYRQAKKYKIDRVFRARECIFIKEQIYCALNKGAFLCPFSAAAKGAVCKLYL